MFEQPIFADLHSASREEAIGGFAAEIDQLLARSRNAGDETEQQAEEIRKRRELMKSYATSLILLAKAENSSGHDDQKDERIVHSEVTKLVDSLPRSWIPEEKEFCCPLFPFCIRKFRNV